MNTNECVAVRKQEIILLLLVGQKLGNSDVTISVAPLPAWLENPTLTLGGGGWEIQPLPPPLSISHPAITDRKGFQTNLYSFL